MGASIALGAVTALLAIGLAIGRIATTSNGALGPDALNVLFDAATGALRTTLIALGAIAVIGIFAAWLAGPWRASAATRRALDRLPSIARRRLHPTNAFSRFLTRRRALVYWVVIAAVVVTVVFFRPLTIGVVVVAALLGAVVLLAVETFRSPSEQPAAPAPVAPAGAAV
ncbi:MAG: hypothetical protein BGO95_06015 [Micrococcales bacterium 73-13]|nr:MAG: hypothetical protein BGO95_06015 [Micrococcales bacterium 73-13]